MFEGNIHSFVNWLPKRTFVGDAVLPCSSWFALMFKNLFAFWFGDFFLNVTGANVPIFHSEKAAENVVNISCSEVRAGPSQRSPGVGVKLTAPPSLRSKSKRTFKPWRPVIQPHYAFLQYHFPSSSHLKRLQLRSTYTSPSGLKKVQLSLSKVRLLAEVSINPEGRVAVLQTPCSICMCWWLQNWKRKA